MSVIFETSKPNQLLTLFKEAINSKVEKGSIKTWKIDTDGDFTREDKSIAKRMWFRAVIEDKKLIFRCLSNTDSNSWFDYAYYHGHLISTFIEHFHSNFTNALITSTPAQSDIIPTPLS